MVYIFDDEHIKVVNYLNSGVDKSIERVRLDETKEVLERLKGVQTQSPLVHLPQIAPKASLPETSN